MKQSVVPLDANNNMLLRFIGVANMLFLIVFMATLLVFAPQAKAGDAPVCTGKNLIAELARTNPKLLEQIDAEAARTLNGQGLLWKIEKDGIQPSWLFGTMHVSDPRVVTLPASAQTAFDGANTVIIETIDILDPAKSSGQLLARSMFTDGTTLSSLLTDEQRETLSKGLEEKGLSLATVNVMKPWMIAATFALPACEMARKKAGEPFLDIKLAEDAKAQGKTLGGLETLVSQVDAMDSLPMDFQIEGLVATIVLGDQIENVIETMIVLYEEQQIGTIWPFIRDFGGTEDQNAAGYAEFEEVLVTTRNRTMAKNARAFLDKGGAFVAVGALHLPGETGLVELLRKEGYRITPME